MTEKQIDECYNQFKEDYLTKNYDGESRLVQTKNILFEISSLEKQKNNNNPNVSSIDIGDCEKILKKHYNISEEESLLIVKTDIKSDDLSTTYVQYEIYHPYTLIQLNMSYCYNHKITIQTPVNLNNETIALYDIASEFGYNIFDSEDPFYNDICTSFTTKHGTDMILSDRQNDIFSLYGNISLCQYGCEFESYNKNTKRAKCNCDIQKEATQTDISKLTLTKNIFISSFLVLMYDSNFLVLKCYKVALDFSNLFINIGRIIMTIILFLYLLLVLIYFIKDRKRIDFYITTILKDKMHFMKNGKMNEVKNIKETKTNIFIENESKRKKEDKKKEKKKSK